MSVFETILHNGISRGHVPAKTEQARNWYRTSAKEFKGRIRGNETRIDYGRSRDLNRKLIKEYENTERAKTEIKPGSMYMYFYDAKHKDTLPFWDRFPLIFPFRVESDRLWGINMHYLPLPLRAKLMDSLYDLTNNNRYDESTKLKLSYQILNASSELRFFKPCVKQYLKSHMRSKFMYIRPEEWDVALFLPCESFVGASKTQVWSDSKTKLGIRK